MNIWVYNDKCHYVDKCIQGFLLVRDINKGDDIEKA